MYNNVEITSTSTPRRVIGFLIFPLQQLSAYVWPVIADAYWIPRDIVWLTHLHITHLPETTPHTGESCSSYEKGECTWSQCRNVSYSLVFSVVLLACKSTCCSDVRLCAPVTFSKESQIRMQCGQCCLIPTEIFSNGIKSCYIAWSLKFPLHNFSVLLMVTLSAWHQ